MRLNVFLDGKLVDSTPAGFFEGRWCTFDGMYNIAGFLEERDSRGGDLVGLVELTLIHEVMASGQTKLNLFGHTIYAELDLEPTYRVVIDCKTLQDAKAIQGLISNSSIEEVTK